jgi:exosortase/archaeosortase family protein
LRYLLPGLALGYIFATLTFRAAIRRWCFLTVCGAILMIANGMRAYGIIIAHHLGIADGADHRLFSYTVFGMTLPFLHWLGLKCADKRTGAPSGNEKLKLGRTHDGRRLIVTTITAILLMAVAPVCLWLWNGSTPP